MKLRIIATVFLATVSLNANAGFILGYMMGSSNHQSLPPKEVHQSTTKESIVCASPNSSGNQCIVTAPFTVPNTTIITMQTLSLSLHELISFQLKTPMDNICITNKTINLVDGHVKSITIEFTRTNCNQPNY